MDVAGWFVPGLAVAVSMAMLSRLLGPAGRARDDSPTGEADAVARVARAVAALSVKISVVVIVDDADRLDAGLARAMVTGLAGRTRKPGSTWTAPATSRRVTAEPPDRFAMSVPRD